MKRILLIGSTTFVAALAHVALADDMPAQAQPTGAPTHGDEYWKDLKTCADANGVIFHQGENGFSGCVDQMKAHEKNQMGGEAAPGTAPSPAENTRTGDTSGDTSPMNGQNAAGQSGSASGPNSASGTSGS
jgi:hypothetical protein